MAAYSYSPYWRATEILGILGFFALVVVLGHEAFTSLRGEFAPVAWWLIPTCLLAAALAADFISGLFHFLADNFGSEDLPILGPNVIRPFRHHHIDPREMTRHDFVETNGNNCLICIPALLATWLGVGVEGSLLGLAWVLFFNVFVLGIFMTNQFHKWSHLEQVPGWISRLQSWHLILPPDHHDLHHTPPFDSNYCITTGWLNPPLEWLKFWSRAEALIRWVTRSPRVEAAARPAAAPPPRTPQQLAH